MRKRNTNKKKSILPVTQADFVSKRTRPFQVPTPDVAKAEDSSQETATADIQARLDHADRFGHDLTQPTVQRQGEPEKEEEEEAPIQAKPTVGQPEDKEEEEESPIQAKSELEKPEEEEDMPIQAKLTMGQSEDKEEKEADDVAQRVMAMPEGNIKEEDEEEKGGQIAPKLQKKKKQGIPSGFEQTLASKQGGGEPLEEETRSFMESRFGADFSDVKVHQEPELTSAIQAQAFTHGKDIYFNSGKYSPGTDGGKELLAHELTHVVQQNKLTAQHSISRRKNKDVTFTQWLRRSGKGFSALKTQLIEQGYRLSLFTYADSVGWKEETDRDNIPWEILSNRVVWRIYKDKKFVSRETTETILPTCKRLLTFTEIDKDRIYEYFAHELSYLDTIPKQTRQYVEKLGFRIGQLIEGEFGFKARVLHPNQREKKRGHVPIVAFRGTEGQMEDVLDDLNKVGPGWRQFSLNRQIIQQQLARSGKSDVTGHSLGGALAQMAAASYSGLVRKVVTFQAPGIPVSMLDELRQEAPKKNLKATHYRAAHGIVDDVGEGHIPGTVYELSFDKTSGGSPGISEVMEAISAHRSSPIKHLRDIKENQPNDLTNVEVTRKKTASPSRDRLFETFRKEVFGIGQPQSHTHIDTPDELLTQAGKSQVVVQKRMNDWMHAYSDRIGTLDKNKIFLLLEAAFLFYEGAEEVDMWHWILDSAPSNFRKSLHRRLIKRINPNGFTKPSHMSQENYKRIRNYRT